MINLMSTVDGICENLPSGFSISLAMEKDAAWVELFDDCGRAIDLPDPCDSTIVEELLIALQIAKEQK